jgi:hypothetical protein
MAVGLTFFSVDAPSLSGEALVVTVLRGLGMGVPFKMVARSVGYRIGKTHASKKQANDVNFDEVFQPKYANEARLGYAEGKQFIEKGRREDTFHKGGKDGTDSRQ